MKGLPQEQFWRALTRRRAILLLLILIVAFATRALTAQFMSAHLNDPAWFQPGSYKMFDERARNILDGRESLFWIDDATRTDRAVYPPGFPLWVAFIYKVSGQRSPWTVHRVHWVLDLLTVLLVVGIGGSTYGWRAGLLGGLLAALSPLLAMYGTWPTADVPGSWLLLSSVWLLLIAAKRQSFAWTIGAGLLLGLACWFRVNPLLLTFFWAAALMVFLQRTAMRKRVLLGAAVIASVLLVVAPITIRNAIVFHEFLPTGLGAGVNLWEGLGETERGREAGFVFGDAAMLEKEKREMNPPTDMTVTTHYPDGIRRDRARAREALKFILKNPVWYVGVMMKRMLGMLKFAGAPLPYYGTAGINVTSKKCLPEGWQNSALAFVVNALGMLQSVLRYLALPLMLYGIWIARRLDLCATGLILSTVLYYLLTSAAAHTEIRYTLPMQTLLFIFAGVGVSYMIDKIYFQVHKGNEFVKDEPGKA